MSKQKKFIVHYRAKGVHTTGFDEREQMWEFLRSLKDGQVVDISHNGRKQTHGRVVEWISTAKHHGPQSAKPL